MPGTLERNYINLGGSLANIGAIRWGFKCAPGIYENLRGFLGVTGIADNDQGGVVYGCNTPRPVRVAIAFKRGNIGGGGAGGTGNDKLGKVRRFCEPDLLNNVLFGSANGAKVRVLNPASGETSEHDIDNVTLS